MGKSDSLLQKLSGRVVESQKFRSLVETCQKSTRGLFERSTVFKEFLKKFPPGLYSLITNIVLAPDSPWKSSGKGAKDLRKNIDHYADLFNAGSILYINFGVDLSLRKLEDGRMEYWHQMLRSPRCYIWKADKEEIKLLQIKEREPEKPPVDGGLYFDGIEINDVATNKGPAFMLGVTSQVFPTLVKYVHGDGFRKLFVSLPEYLDVRSFFKNYRTLLSNVHRDFYQISYRKPKTSAYQQELMQEIWEQKCKGRKFSNYRQAKILSETLAEEPYRLIIEPLTIVRWYLPKIRREAKDKK